jgi:hypothetical protein
MAVGSFARVGGRIFEIGGSTDFGFGSALDESARFGLLSSMSETVSGFGGGGGIAGAGPGAVSGTFGLMIGETVDLEEVLVSVGGFFLLGEIRSVAG